MITSNDMSSYMLSPSIMRSASYRPSNPKEEKTGSKQTIKMFSNPVGVVTNELKYFTSKALRIVYSVFCMRFAWKYYLART